MTNSNHLYKPSKVMMDTIQKKVKSYENFHLSSTLLRGSKIVITHILKEMNFILELNMNLLEMKIVKIYYIYKGFIYLIYMDFLNKYILKKIYIYMFE